MKDKPPSLRRLEGEVLRLIKQAKEERKAKSMPVQLKNIALKVFNSETKGGRTRRTFLQAFIGLVGGLALIFTIEPLYLWFEGLPWVIQMGGLSTFIYIVSVIQNYSKTVWEWVKEA